MKEADQETVAMCETKDMTAIFDRFWQKRGHTSLNSIVSGVNGDRKCH